MLIAGRLYKVEALQPLGDVPPGELIRALLGITVARIQEYPADTGARLLAMLGASADTENDWTST